MLKRWINITNSFAQAETFNRNYYQAMSPQQRLETVQLLRENYYKLKKGLLNAHRKGLRRFIKIIQQT